MLDHTHTARPVLLGCALLSLSLGAAAQGTPPPGIIFVPGPNVVVQSAAESTPAQDGTSDQRKPDAPAANTFGVLSSVDGQKFQQQLDERQEQLRRQLADPKQRAQVRAAKLEQVRASHFDLARLLRLDSRTEEKVLGMLADQQLADELAPRRLVSFVRSGGRPDALPRPALPQNPMKSETQRYTQQMGEIRKLLGAARLDQYLDYQKTLPYRSQVEQFNSTLPAEQQLNSEQKDTMVALLQDQMERSLLDWTMLRSFSRSDFSGSAEERNRRMQVLNITTNERSANNMEAANRELLERLTSVLTPEQSKAFAAQRQQQLESLRAWSQQLRRNLGVGPEEELETAGATSGQPLLSSNLLLAIKVNINDTEVTKTLTSIRGSTVSFQAPEGVLVEVRPYLIEQDDLRVEIKLYEAVPGPRRLLTQASSGAQLTNPRQPATLTSVGGISTMARGRKGYMVNCSVTATYQ